MLDITTKEQLKDIFAELRSNYIFATSQISSHPKGEELRRMLNDIAECSANISATENSEQGLRFEILKDGARSGVSFRAIPSGHEFNSLILAILNMDGRGKNLPDEFTLKRIKALKGEISLTTYMSLSCTNCPDVVQSLNIIAALSRGNITHEAVDGALFEDEVSAKGIQAVPTIYGNDELLHVGRSTLAELLSKLEAHYGAEIIEENATKEYDLIIAGGGAAGVTSAIYTARKGLRVAIITDRIGGQINETATIENIPSIKSTLGSKLAEELRAHTAEYQIDIFENREIKIAESSATTKRLICQGGEVFTASQLIIATGAVWRRLGVVGESEYTGRGVAFCPHCDGALFKDKVVAVVGGGNSGVEAAIELSGICTKVYLIEFLEELKADMVLQDAIKMLDNVEVITNSQTTEIVGDNSKVTSLTLRNRASNEMRSIALDGIFVQIGMSPNSEIFRPIVEVNSTGEIYTDRNGRTSTKGVYAAGDVTQVSYKQVVIAMGEGAKCALAAFDDRIRLV